MEQSTLRQRLRTRRIGRCGAAVASLLIATALVPAGGAWAEPAQTSVEAAAPAMGSAALAPPLTSASTVAVTGTSSTWTGATTAPSPEFDLLVDGEPYTVKGFTWGPGESEGDRYLPGVAATGANTIRTWGTGSGSAALFDSAARHGIRVIAGFWLKPGGGPGSGGCVDYVTDQTYRTTTKADIIRWVRAYRSKPAVLMWNVGNESLLGMAQCWTGAKLEQQRTAYAAYVDELARAIHAEDPTHPVTSTDAWTGAWPYYRAQAPSLDLYSVNNYGGVCFVPGDHERGGYTKPYLVTEAAAAGDWEVATDPNGVPREPTDAAKAKAYTDAWNCLSADSDRALGATFFHYGVEDDFGGVWFNVLTGGERRLGWYALSDAFGGTPATNRPPGITSISIANATSIAAGSRVSIDFVASDPDRDALTFSVGLGSKYLDGSNAIVPTPATVPGTARIEFTAPTRAGVWKAYLYARDGRGNVGIEAVSFRVR